MKPRGKFNVGYKQGLWTIVEYPYKSKKALLRCECGHESWKFLANLSSRNSQGCRSCMFTSPEHKTYLSVMRGAAGRSKQWDLSEDEWVSLSKQNCFYCDQEPSNFIVAIGYKYSGLDRIDSSIGYTLTNVVPCCIVCNRAKSNLPAGEFEDWIKRVYVKIISK